MKAVTRAEQVLILVHVEHKLIKISFLLFLPFFIYSCQQEPTSIYQIDINPNNRITSKIAFNDIVSSIEYIPLETNDQNIIGHINLYDISSNYILIFCEQSRGLHLFRKNGSYVAKIGSYGSGPGEYEYVRGGIVNEQQNQIIIKTFLPDNIIIYDFNGNWVESLSADLGEKNGCRILSMANNNYLFIYSNTAGNKPYTYEIRDRNLNLLTQGLKAIPYTVNMGEGRMGNVFLDPFDSYYIYNDLIHVKENSLNDTVYVVDTNNQFIPMYTISTYPYDLTVEIRSDFRVKGLENCAVIHSIFEYNNHIFIHYVYQREHAYCYYEKQQKQLFHFSSTNGIPNNIDGGPAFWPQWQNNNTWYALYEANTFEETDLTFSNSAVRNYRNFIRDLDPENNPVLVIVTLK